MEKLKPNIYTCAELYNCEFSSHLQMGKVNDFVVTGEHSAFLLVHAALNRSMVGKVFTDLLTFKGDDQFFRLPTTPEWIGKPFLNLFIHLKTTCDAILVAVYDAEGRYYINPKHYVFEEGAEAVVIASRDIKL